MCWATVLGFGGSLVTIVGPYLEMGLLPVVRRPVTRASNKSAAGVYARFFIAISFVDGAASMEELQRPLVDHLVWKAAFVVNTVAEGECVESFATAEARGVGDKLASLPVSPQFTVVVASEVIRTTARMTVVRWAAMAEFTEVF